MLLSSWYKMISKRSSCFLCIIHKWSKESILYLPSNYVPCTISIACALIAFIIVHCLCRIRINIGPNIKYFVSSIAMLVSHSGGIWETSKGQLRIKILSKPSWNTKTSLFDFFFKKNLHLEVVVFVYAWNAESEVRRCVNKKGKGHFL